MDKDVKDELLNKLLCEQGHLCAYCMKRIPETRKLPQGVPPVTNEHWLPRNPMNQEKGNRDLDYRNMFAVCSGNRRQVLQALIADVKKKHGSGAISIYCRRKLEQIKGMDDPKLPYVGVLIAWLEKHI